MAPQRVVAQRACSERAYVFQLTITQLSYYIGRYSLCDNASAPALEPEPLRLYIYTDRALGIYSLPKGSYG